MPLLYIYFKPTNAPKYRIEWKRSTEDMYPPGQEATVDKAGNGYNSYSAAIPDLDSDWNYRITALCLSGPSGPFYGNAIATCKKVSFTATYNHCTCGTPIGITATTN